MKSSISPQPRRKYDVATQQDHLDSRHLPKAIGSLEDVVSFVLPGIYSKAIWGVDEAILYEADHFSMSVDENHFTYAVKYQGRYLMDRRHGRGYVDLVDGKWIHKFTETGAPTNYKSSIREPRVHGRLSEAEYDELLTPSHHEPRAHGRLSEAGYDELLTFSWRMDPHLHRRAKRLPTVSP